MTAKTCIACRKSKPESSFRWWVKAKGLRKPRCGPCDAAYRKRYRQEHLETTAKRDRRALKARKARVASGFLVEPKFRTCISCHQRKPSVQFGWRMKSALYRKARCLDCDGKHRAGKYLENPKRYIDSNRATRAKLRALMEHHKDLPCVDCHKRYPPWVMDFDHRPGERKIAKVSAFIYFGSETKLLNEIAKCDPVCSNCHRIRTHNRRLKGRNEPRKHGTSRKGCSAARLVR